jgi:hypothetical protein
LRVRAALHLNARLSLGRRGQIHVEGGASVELPVDLAMIVSDRHPTAIHQRLQHIHLDCFVW